MKQLTIKPAYKGLGTEFSESEQPQEFARKLENRFINIYGAAELRPGIAQIESPGTKFYDGTDFTTVTGKCDTLLEYAPPQGGSEDLCSLILTAPDPSDPTRTITYRQVHRYSTTAQAWVNVDFPDDPNVPVSGLSVTTTFDPVKENDIFAVQFDEKLIIVGEQYRPFFYVNDPVIGPNVFLLNPVVNQGTTGTGTTKSILKDALITDWLNETYVKPNDIVYNITKQAYGIITSVGASNLDCSPITSAGGTSGIGVTTVVSGDASMEPGDMYQIHDSRELNVFKTGKSNSGAFFADTSDNLAVTTTGTDQNTIAVSGVNFNKTQVRIGDYVYNTTRNRLARIYPANTHDGKNANGTLNLSYLGLYPTGVSAQVPGDTVVLFKSACPISVFPHIHYGRLYLIDERDRTKIRVTGPDDPQDFTTFDTTLDAAGSLNYGSKQPVAEELLTMSTFQKYLCVGGKKNIYLADGADPIQDTSAATVTFTPVGLFSQGCVSNLSLANIGSDMLFAANDGMRSFNILDVLQVKTDNISEVIKTELRNAIKSTSDQTNIQLVHYPRRNWVMFKVGDVIYNFNYTPIYIEGQLIKGGTWSKFTGTFAECNAFLVKRNGDLVCSFYDTSAATSYFYDFDTGYYTDATEGISTEYQSAWLTPSGEGEVSDLRYIRPFFENVGNIDYNIIVSADLQRQVTDDSIIYTASGGNAVDWVIGQDPVNGSMDVVESKLALRSRGEQMRISINTSASENREQISKYVLYLNTFGRD